MTPEIAEFEVKFTFLTLISEVPEPPYEEFMVETVEELSLTFLFRGFLEKLSKFADVFLF